MKKSLKTLAWVVCAVIVGAFNVAYLVNLIEKGTTVVYPQPPSTEAKYRTGMKRISDRHKKPEIYELEYRGVTRQYVMVRDSRFYAPCYLTAKDDSGQVFRFTGRYYGRDWLSRIELTEEPPFTLPNTRCWYVGR